MAIAPPTIEWSLSESGLEDFERWVEHALVESADMSEPLRDVRDHVQYMIFDEFISEGLRSGGWEPLNLPYELWKLGRGQFDILRLDPALLHGHPGTPRDEEMYNVLLDDASWDITADDAIFHPDSTRAAWHQSGVLARRKGGRLPARPPLVFLETDYAAIDDIFERWMEEDVIH